ncbi:arsenate reductase ArsC [Rhabdothermincola salaria]|uniref:arsenate reductase ArsC n=1 Tax=Rhabdothermincola salaria TaxID=2903142 RepID=UPI001E2962C5|nr:arsenate reductase ArsC [Rhabdothermincola salaria]MCD9624590.1 arsenate reductase ArsC [Rhabdothermincola salaria]
MSDATELTTEQQLMLREGARRISQEFSGVFSPETIERYLDDSRDQLLARARFTEWLPILIERFARERLRALARLEVGTPDRPAVLFLCVHNAGRSQMAAGWLRHLAGDQIDVFSGGSDPGSQINPAAVEAMAEIGVDIADESPKPWTDEIARAADVIITMGCGDACPIFPGKRYEDWVLEDPAGQSVAMVRGVRDDIGRRVRELMASLDVPTMA